MNHNGNLHEKHNGTGEKHVMAAVHRMGQRNGSSREKQSRAIERGTGSYREALEAERRNLMLGLGNTEIVELPPVADEMDTCSLEHERHVAMDTRSRKTMLLEDINDALVKIGSETFGICEECEEPIAAGRLNALPWARLCIRCQQEQEVEGGAEIGEPKLVLAGR